MTADHLPYRPPEVERQKCHESLPISNLTAIALCGGIGSRLETLTKGMIPKLLVKVNDKPLIDYSIDPLYVAGVKKFLFAAAYRADLIEAYVKNKSYLQDAIISIDPPHGVVYALKSALNNFDIIGPTTIFDTDAIREGLDFADAYKFHTDMSADVTFISTRTNEPKDSNFIILNEPNNDTAAILLHAGGAKLEDPIIKCGMMICSPRATKLIKNAEDIPNSWIGLVEYVSMLGHTKTYVTPQPLIYSNVNTPQELWDIEARLKTNR